MVREQTDAIVYPVRFGSSRLMNEDERHMTKIKSTTLGELAAADDRGALKIDHDAEPAPEVEISFWDDAQLVVPNDRLSVHTKRTGADTQ